MSIYFDPNSVGPVKPVDGEKETAKPSRVSIGSGDFAAVLRDVQSERPVRFSAHAQRRLASRGIEPGQETIQRLQTAVNKAESKGSRDSLVLVDSLAFIVAVRNRTVVTAFDIYQMKEDVITNIDSAVIS